MDDPMARMAGPARDDPDFERERPRLFGIAYRMLGSVVEAEDILQDAYLRWARAREREPTVIESPTAYLVRVVTRLCIDALRSAHARRMSYVGPWLPEPVLEHAEIPTHDPLGGHPTADDLSVAFLVMLERLGPVERAVLLLRESFDFGYREIAEVVGKSEENCRQIDRRARMRLSSEGRAAQPVDRRSHERLLRRFLEATRSGDIEGLIETLTEDVVSYADGGGKVVAARRPVVGAAAVAKYLIGLMRLAPPGLDRRIATVNGEPGLLTFVDGGLHNVVSVSVHDERISRIFIIVNPDKLMAARSAPRDRTGSSK